MYKIHINTQKNLCPQWYFPYTKWKMPKSNWLKLNKCYSFDKKKLLKEALQVKKSFNFKPFPIDETRKRRTYRGICLTAKKNSKDPLYEGLKIFNEKKALNVFDTIQRVKTGQDPGLYEKDFVEKTEIYKGYIGEILNKFKSPFSKIRILELKKGGLVVPHVDFPYYKHIRIHTVLQTNDKAFWSVGGEQFQIPSDGHWYWFDVGKTHSVWNYGREDRIVLSLNLSIYEDKLGRPCNINKSFEELIVSRRL